jgi:antitoxin PrlF
MRILTAGKEVSMSSATLTSKGQITVPKDIRTALRLDPGDVVEFVVQADGSVKPTLRRRDVRTLAGMLARPGRPAVTLEAMNAAIGRRGAAIGDRPRHHRARPLHHAGRHASGISGA